MPLTQNLFTALDTVPLLMAVQERIHSTMNRTTFSHYCFQNTFLHVSRNTYFYLLTVSEGSDTVLHKVCQISLTACYAHLRLLKHSFHEGNRLPNSENESAVVSPR